jgi:hypothetical protein
MSRYLQKLHSKKIKTPLPGELTKLTKPLDDGNKVGSVGFVSSSERGLEKILSVSGSDEPCGKSAAEPSQIFQIPLPNEPTKLTKPYGAAVAALAVCPDRVPEGRWQDCVADAHAFLQQWGERAHELGWTARDLFGLSEVPANPAPLYSRMSRYDETGLLWLLEGRKTVVAMTTDTAAVRHPSGSITMYRRHRKPGLGPLGDSLDDFEV